MLTTTVVLVNIANLLYLASYLGRDILWLRVLQCCGIVVQIGFFRSCQESQNSMDWAIAWLVAFLVINVYQIYALVQQRRRLRLSSEQEVIRKGMMNGLSDRELVNTLARALHSDDEHVMVITEQGESVLTPDEIAFRDIALKQLSRKDLINLLSRRTWRSLERLQPQWEAENSQLR